MKSRTLTTWGIIVLLGAVAAVLVYQRFLGSTAIPSSRGEFFVEIPTNATFEEVLAQLRREGIVRQPRLFRQLADWMDYRRDPMRSGRFALRGGMNLLQIIRKLRSGAQSPVKVVLTTQRLPAEVAAKVAGFLEPDSATLMQQFADEDFLQELGIAPETLMTLFIPNTYEFFWNTSAKGFLERMKKEHDAFWRQTNRLAKARALGLSPAEVYTLASIVEKETLVNSEKPTIAGVYLNRLKINMRLQADPTVVFATRDFTTKRVTNFHTQFESPYNTYLNTGLPPGPICLASISSIDAVLNREDHNYTYFCAAGDGSGRHNFAETYEQHLNNVATYQRNLEQRGLR